MPDNPDQKDLPEIVQQYIKRLAHRVSNRHMCRDVLAELTEHFTDALADIPQDSNRDELAGSLIADFGDTKILGKLIKRAKKRCCPTWLKVIGYTCRVVIVIFVIFAAYSAWFLTGKATISVDYLDKLNEMVRPAADESQNAAPHYLKVMELYVEPEENHDLRKFEKLLSLAPDPKERQVLKEWIQRNQAAIRQVRVGTTKPHCWFTYDVRPHSERALINIIIPYIKGLRQISIALSWQMQFAAEKGNWDSVIADLRSAKTLAKHLMGCPTLIEQLVGIAVDQRTNQQLMRILRGHTLPAKINQDLALILVESFPSGYPIADIGRESDYLLDMVQRVFTDDGSGDGHLIPFTLRRFMPRSSSVDISERPIDLAMAMVHSSRRETVQFIEQWKQMSDRYRSVTPYQNHISGESMDAWLRKTIEENPENLFLNNFLPSLQEAVRISYAGQAEHLAAQTIVALLRHQSDHAQFPESLDQLVPQYLRAVPQDPFGPGPLSYKRQGDDFILYSWGSDCEDHGGWYNPDVFGTRKAGGDNVFWPPQPVERPRGKASRR